MLYAIIIIFIILIIIKVRRESFGGRPRVTFHYAPWCGACKNAKKWWYAPGSYGIFERNEINEDVTPTPGVNRFPTFIIKYDDYVAKFEGSDRDNFFRWLRSEQQKYNRK